MLPAAAPHGPRDFSSPHCNRQQHPLHTHRNQTLPKSTTHHTQRQHVPDTSSGSTPRTARLQLAPLQPSTTPLHTHRHPTPPTSTTHRNYRSQQQRPTDREASARPTATVNNAPCIPTNTELAPTVTDASSGSPSLTLPAAAPHGPRDFSSPHCNRQQRPLAYPPPLNSPPQSTTPRNQPTHPFFKIKMTAPTLAEQSLTPHHSSKCCQSSSASTAPPSPTPTASASLSTSPPATSSSPETSSTPQQTRALTDELRELTDHTPSHRNRQRRRSRLAYFRTGPHPSRRRHLRLPR